MEIVSLDGIILDPDLTAEKLRVFDRELLNRLIGRAGTMIAASAGYRAVRVQEKLRDGVVIDGAVFTSRVLRHNLERAGCVFPFVLTIGGSLDEIIENEKGMIEKYLFSEIGNIALDQARRLFENHIKSTFSLENVSCVVPGSLEDWPVEQQKYLFSLLPGLYEGIGVILTGSSLMLPLKSISGIYFQSESAFYSCQLCPRGHCEGRKAGYDEEMRVKYGISGCPADHV